MRYTGDKFIDVADGLLNVEDVFYVRHPGEFRDRNGKTCIWTAEDREIKYEKIRDACIDYKYDVQVKNMPYEMAREFLPYCYRQNFDMFGTLESLFHLLDQRTKADAEREIRILSGLLFNILAKVAPELADWYLLNRYGKARLAP
jgi:thymidylate synthase (FAD)